MNDLQIIPVQEIKAQVNAIQELMRGVMQEDTHYGKIPGCGDKPTLLKAGAEKLAMAFRLDIQTETEIVELDNDHREYRCTTSVYSMGSGTRLGNGAGCATTMETKWRYRTENTGAEVPKEYWKTRNSELLGGSQFSTRKIDGKWFIFHKVEHDNPADYYNTCQKMAEKRSKVCAVLNVTAASDIFTQDIEDMTPGTVSNGKDKGKGKPAVKKTERKSAAKTKTTPAPTDAITTTIGSIAEKDGKKPHKIHCEDDVVCSTYSDSFKDIAQAAMESGLKVTITTKGDQYNTIDVIDIVEETYTDESNNPREEEEQGDSEETQVEDQYADSQ